jgi:MFS family permease
MSWLSLVKMAFDVATVVRAVPRPAKVEPTPEASAEEVYPSTELAYGFVLPSYALLAARFEAAPNRLAALMTIATSIAAAAPIVGRAIGTPFSGPLFYGWVTTYVFGMFLALLGRYVGMLALPDPLKIHQTELHKQPNEFMRDALYWAGRHFAENKRAIAVKATFGLTVALLVIVQIGFVIFWLGGPRPPSA